MEFSPLKLQDLEQVRPFFQLTKSRTCDFSAGGMFMWRDYFHMEFCIEHKTLFTKLKNAAGETFFTVPIGGDEGQGLDQIRTYCREAGLPCRLCTVPAEYLRNLADHFQELNILQQPEYADYLYLAADLANFQGKKFGGQRNHLRKFLNTNPGWTFQELTQADIPEILRFLERCFRLDALSFQSAREEEKMTLEVLNNYALYGMTGAVLRVDGEIIGFTLGEIIRDTLLLHIEKADRNYPGAYQMIVNQFALRAVEKGIVYINREEDMGDPGLRYSKLSYNPVTSLKKYVVEVMA